MRETQVQSLGREDPLEEEMATHSRILAWRIPWTEEPGGLQSVGLQRVRNDWVTNTTLLNRASWSKVNPGGLWSILTWPFQMTRQPQKTTCSVDLTAGGQKMFASLPHFLHLSPSDSHPPHLDLPCPWLHREHFRCQKMFHTSPGHSHILWLPETSAQSLVCHCPS